MVLQRGTCCRNNKVWENTLAHGASSSVDQELKRIRKRHGTTICTYRRTHRTLWKPSSPMVRKIYGKPPGDPVEDLNVFWAIWRMFMNTTLRAAVHLGNDYDTNLRFVKNYLENNRTASQGNGKADQLSHRNHRHKPDQFPRFKVDVDKLIAQSSLSIFHCQSLRLLRFCTLFGKDWRRSC